MYVRVRIRINSSVPAVGAHKSPGDGTAGGFDGSSGISAYRKLRGRAGTSTGGGGGQEEEEEEGMGKRQRKNVTKSLHPKRSRVYYVQTTTICAFAVRTRGRYIPTTAICFSLFFFLFFLPPRPSHVLVSRKSRRKHQCDLSMRTTRTRTYKTTPRTTGETKKCQGRHLRITAAPSRNRCHDSEFAGLRIVADSYVPGGVLTSGPPHTPQTLEFRLYPCSLFF